MSKAMTPMLPRAAEQVIGGIVPSTH